MNRYLIQPVGLDGPPRPIEAHSPTEAVAVAAGCDRQVVCTFIWTEKQATRFFHDRLGNLRPYLHHDCLVRECYMPRDDTGRQWIVDVS